MAYTMVTYQMILDIKSLSFRKSIILRQLNSSKDYSMQIYDREANGRYVYNSNAMRILKK